MVSGLVWLVDEEDELMVNRAGLWGLPVGVQSEVWAGPAAMFIQP